MNFVRKHIKCKGEVFMIDELERICYNCSSFFMDVNDFGSGKGVCINDEAFQEYLDEILENSDFSVCMSLYKEKRFNGERDVCADYNEVEIIEVEEAENGNLMTEEELNRQYEIYQTQDVDGITKSLCSEEEKEKNKAISALLYLINFNNKNAFNAMLNYYNNLPPAESIDAVHHRLDILKRFYHFYYNNRGNELIDMLVDQLYKMHSNNTTRQLFSSILKFLSGSACESDIVIDKLSWLLNNKKFSTRMEQNIYAVIQKHENKGIYWF